MGITPVQVKQSYETNFRPNKWRHVVSDARKKKSRLTNVADDVKAFAFWGLLFSFLFEESEIRVLLYNMLHAGVAGGNGGRAKTKTYDVVQSCLQPGPAPVLHSLPVPVCQHNVCMPLRRAL